MNAADEPSAGVPPARPRPRPASLTELFLVFSALALRGFGGVLPWAQRVLVDDRGWLTREEFVEMLAFGQMLPGPNVCNVALMVGDRWFGWRGAVAALGGMLSAPCVVVLSLAVLYGQVADDPVVRRALIGMGAVAGGMILGTALRLATTQRRRAPWLVFGALAFAGVALLRIELAWVVLALGPVAVLAAWLTNRRRGGGAAR
ncbi:MAG: chromate transporter [Burkholderiales bacterium]|nr:chromate transporter [Burkholderiales bacterium]